ncbi:MAG TPA: NAD-dependent epimerase/dehydratase family protein [Nitriliruptorales bacterium]|nr:NAD-dependent epimerase/dehydratase family protein [Nitriliruptorales bacterium]
MRVVVLGATGNVGIAVVRALAAADQVEEVVGVARRLPDLDVPGTRWESADVTRDDLVGHLQGAQAVVHLAWQIQPSRDPRATWRTNVEGTVRVLEAVASAGVRSFVYASSVGAYSPGPKGDAVDESWPTHGIPTSNYSREKAYVERLLDTFTLEHPEVRVVRLRPGLIFQDEAASEVRRFFLGSLFPNRLADARLLPVVPNVSDVRFQAVHTADVAEAYRLALVGDAHGAFNVAAEPVLDLPTVARLLDARAFTVPRAVVRPAAALTWWLRLHPVEPGWVDLALHAPVMDVSRARAELGWVARRGADEAVTELLAGIAAGRGAPTPTLEPDRERSRTGELATGQGARYDRPEGVG